MKKEGESEKVDAPRLELSLPQLITGRMASCSDHLLYVMSHLRQQLVGHPPRDHFNDSSVPTLTPCPSQSLGSPYISL